MSPPVSVTLHEDGQRRRRSRIGGAMHLDTPATENAEQHATKLAKRHLVKPFWVLIVPFLFPSELAAEPLLAETVQYIDAKVSSIPSGYTGGFRLNGETAIYHIYSDGETSTFQLGDLSTTPELSPRHIDVGGEFSVRTIVARCARRKCVRVTRPETSMRRGVNSIRGEVTFYVLFRDWERVLKALTHAIKLSGGKDELF